MNAILGTVLLLFALPATAEDLRVGTMHVTWPDGCQGRTQERTIRMDCQGGERIIISPTLARSDLEEQQAVSHFTQMIHDMSAKVMAPSAEKGRKGHQAAHRDNR